MKGLRGLSVVRSNCSSTVGSVSLCANEADFETIRARMSLRQVRRDLRLGDIGK